MFTDQSNIQPFPLSGHSPTLPLYVSLSRLQDENKKHQDLILGICSEKDTMRGELKKRGETERLHMATISKVSVMETKPPRTHAHAHTPAGAATCYSVRS